jgi:murein DD-endopeptidase MepM/ murein hydrolase activator NlpD
MDLKLTITPKFILIALFGAVCVMYAITKSCSHYTNKNYTQHKLSLPNLESHNVDVEEQSKAPVEPEWTTIITKPKDTLGNIFKQQGLSQKTLQNILHDIKHAKLLAGIKPQQKIQFLIHNDNLQKLIIPLNPKEFLVISLENNRYISKVNTRAMETHNQYVTATLQGSLYGTAKRANIPYKIIQQMSEIFTWDIDFARDVRSGDQFSILYSAHYINDQQVGVGDILAVSYNNRGKVHQAIRHTTSYGSHDYFTPEGASLKKAFSRYPVNFSHISSTFSLSRQHPILHYKRPHKGIDLAAPLGTPIRATGDGRITYIGRQNGYGNVVKISHQTIYSSVYGHLLRFQKGLSKGSFIQRGQIIGYVGQSGLASGPHCHYEFHVNHQPQNPTTVALPRALPISTKELAAFKIQANNLLASLKLYESSKFAKAKTTTKVT